MRTPKVLRTPAFRIVAIYLAIFAISAIALAGFVYWNTALVLDRETDQTIEAEITGLVDDRHPAAPDLALELVLVSDRPDDTVVQGLAHASLVDIGGLTL